MQRVSDSDPVATHSCLVRTVRPVDLGAPTTGHRPDPVDVRVREGHIVAIGSSLEVEPGERIVDGAGRWALPGLWDQHVHLDQWALTTQRLDLSGTASADEVCQRVAELAAVLPAGRALQGFGHRTASWQRQPTVTELDAVTGDRPTVLISGDAHHGWLNTAALRALGLPLRDTVVEEAEWFASYARLAELPGVRDVTDQAVREALDTAAAKGIVGITDLEFAANHRSWPARCADGSVPTVRVRAGVYPDELSDVVAAGLRTGDQLAGTGGLVTMGPLKIISDGSLHTRTAFCCQAYADGGGLPHPRGIQNVPPNEQRELLARARAAGLSVAVHAIGDAAVRDALDAFAASGAQGSIEHAQLIGDADLPRLADLGVAASLQPAHLLDDHEVIDQCWPTGGRRCFRTGTMIHTGVDVRFGSDAPVSPLDPWLTMAAAVHRGDPSDPAWHPEESVSVREALGCSTDGVHRLATGGPGDIILLDDNPLLWQGTSAELAVQLREMTVAATIVAGRPVARRLISQDDGATGRLTPP